jgi:hypothetical protein
MATEITMADGKTRFLTIPSTTPQSLIESLERHKFVEIDLEEDKVVYINPLHVAFIRDT